VGLSKENWKVFFDFVTQEVLNAAVVSLRLGELNGMDVSEEELQQMHASLSHPIRRKILQILRREGKASFTDIINELVNVDTGKLSYHLAQMHSLLQQDEKKRYYLSRLGKMAVTVEDRAADEQDIHLPQPQILTGQPYCARAMIIWLCGLSGWLSSMLLPFPIGPIACGVLLGTVLTYKLNINEWQSIRAGFVSGVISGTLTATGTLASWYVLSNWFVSSTVLPGSEAGSLTYYNLAVVLVVSPVAYVIASAFVTLLLRSIVKDTVKLLFRLRRAGGNKRKGGES
jgi:hypothetical protein